jgi:hypothetical protein
VKKLIAKTSKEMASEFAHVLKKENKKNKAAEKSLAYVEDVLKGKSDKKAMGKKEKGKEKRIEAA